MDLSSLEGFGTLLMKIKIYPYFDIAHYMLMCFVVRDDISHTQSAAPYFSKKHPLACWLSSMLLCFGGGILAHFFLGEPILDDFKSHQNILLATFVWYTVFYSPYDIVYKIGKFLPIKLLLCAMKEVQRTRKIYEGVNHAHHLFPNSYVIITVIGACKGAGSGLMSVLDRLVRGVWLPHTNEILSPSFATKGCVLSSIIFLLERKAIIIMPRPLVYLTIASVFVYVKLISTFFKSFDPFVPFENLFSALFFGGLLDALRKATGSQAAHVSQSNSSTSTLSTQSNILNESDAKNKDTKKTN